MKKLLPLLLLLMLIQAKAQAPEQDCLNAIPICTTTYNQPNSYSGSGNVTGEIPPSSCLGAGELNAVWYKLIVTSPGNLSFTICPFLATDDYDWAVFNLTGKTCADIANNPLLERACDFSGSLIQDGCTGPNGGSNPQDEATIPVNTNEAYYICVSNFSSTQSGYTLNFSASSCGLDSCLTQIINGISKTQTKTEAQLYPNPAAQNITIKLNSLKFNETYSIHIYNSAGALVKEQYNIKQSGTTYDISTLPVGLYTYLITTTEGKFAVGRFVKQ